MCIQHRKSHLTFHHYLGRVLRKKQCAVFVPEEAATGFSELRQKDQHPGAASSNETHSILTCFCFVFNV